MAICINCGTQVPDSVAFCTNCGTAMTVGEKPAPADAAPANVAQQGATPPPITLQPIAAVPDGRAEKPKKEKKHKTPKTQEERRRDRRRLIKLVPWLVSLALLLALLGVIFVPRWFPGGGVRTYRTAEKAIESTFRLLIDCDVDGALASMWGANEQATDLVSFDAQLAHTQAFVPASSLLPGEYEPYAQLNAERMRADAVNAIRCFYLSVTDAVLSGELDLDGLMYTDGTDTAALSRGLNPRSVRDIQILDIQLAVPGIQNAASMQESLEKQNTAYGFLEYRQYVVLLSLYGRQYACGATAVRTDDGWQVCNLTAQLAGFSSYGGIVETTQAEYEEMTR